MRSASTGAGMWNSIRATREDSASFLSHFPEFLDNGSEPGESVNIWCFCRRSDHCSSVCGFLWGSHCGPVFLALCSVCLPVPLVPHVILQDPPSQAAARQVCYIFLRPGSPLPSPGAHLPITPNSSGCGAAQRTPRLSPQ